MSLTYIPDKALVVIDGIEVKEEDLFRLSKDQGTAIATWRRHRRERIMKLQGGLPLPTLIQKVAEEIDRKIITELVAQHTESKRNTNLIALKCRMRELYGIGRPKGR